MANKDSLDRKSVIANVGVFVKYENPREHAGPIVGCACARYWIGQNKRMLMTPNASGNCSLDQFVGDVTPRFCYGGNAKPHRMLLEMIENILIETCNDDRFNSFHIDFHPWGEGTQDIIWMSESPYNADSDSSLLDTAIQAAGNRTKVNTLFDELRKFTLENEEILQRLAAVVKEHNIEFRVRNSSGDRAKEQLTFARKLAFSAYHEICDAAPEKGGAN